MGLDLFRAMLQNIEYKRFGRENDKLRFLRTIRNICEIEDQLGIQRRPFNLSRNIIPSELKFVNTESFDILLNNLQSRKEYLSDYLNDVYYKNFGIYNLNFSIKTQSPIDNSDKILNYLFMVRLIDANFLIPSKTIELKFKFSKNDVNDLCLENYFIQCDILQKYVDCMKDYNYTSKGLSVPYTNFKKTLKRHENFIYHPYEDQSDRFSELFENFKIILIDQFDQEHVISYGTDIRHSGEKILGERNSRLLNLEVLNFSILTLPEMEKVIENYNEFCDTNIGEAFSKIDDAFDKIIKKLEIN